MYYHKTIPAVEDLLEDLLFIYFLPTYDGLYYLSYPFVCKRSTSCYDLLLLFITDSLAKMSRTTYIHVCRRGCEQYKFSLGIYHQFLVLAVVLGDVLFCRFLPGSVPEE